MELSTEKAFETELPPGTVRLQDEDKEATLLWPRPSSDPNQPLNWSKKRKVIHMVLLCIYTTLVFALLTVTPPLWATMTDELGISFEDLNYGYATGYAALTVFALVFVPLSIMYGRRPVYLATSMIMLAASIWMGKTRTTLDVIGSGFLVGIAGSVNEALFNVTICDLFFVHQRGTITGLYLLVVTIGTYLAPVASGYIAVSQGWRWVFTYCTIFMSATVLAMVFFLEETKWEEPASLLMTEDRSVARQDVSHATEKHLDGKTRDYHRAGSSETIALKTYRQRHPWYTPSRDTSTPAIVRFMRHIYHPFLILVTFPAAMFSALQYAWSESMLSFLAVSQANLYPLPPYNFSPIGVGNMNIAPGIGAILGSIFGGPFSDYLIIRIARRRGGIYEPEYRLYPFLLPGACMVAGVLTYGLTVAQGMPWIINAFGCGLVGFGLGACADMALVYVQDSYDGIIGPALIGVVFVRNGMATVMTFVIPIWMDSMGVYNMFLLLGILTALVMLTSVPLLIWGKRWRIKLGDKYKDLAKHV
ncbi:putative MFS-type transporter [Cyphellophora attinorum]|uniref:Putative MFS-type transporter n=1 Tax=Cyphellophora attinorum TaxID=1664694 RepID=A0A0N0NRR4_9EURO|nr:putative MFS-type transporter [Phialophora attinorum]KPI45398.1 putative MFS-type transporter [Phialophora attinorum]